MLEPNCNGDIIRYTSVNDGYEKNRLLTVYPMTLLTDGMSQFFEL